MTEEMVRDLEQIKHTIETVQKDLPRSQMQSETQTSSVKIVTPIYKLQEKHPGSEIQMGGSHAHTERISSQNGDYKAERSSEQFRMQIIDPRVNSNAHIPSQTGSLPNYGRRTVGDFPSEHGKRSLLNLDPLEQRRIRSIQSRPITTSTYLTESLDRHREMEASKLRQFLKASEDDANKPWNKPAWPGPKGDDTGESMRELELIRKKIDNLQKAAQEPKKDASSATWQFNNSFSPKSIVSLNGAKFDEGLLKVRTTVAASEHDEKPRSIMKRSQLESREQMTYAEPERRIEVVRARPKVTETVSRVEEQKRTEEVERRIIRRERRHKSSRHRYGHGHHAEYVDYGNGGGEEKEAIVAEARRAAAEAKLLAAEKRERERVIQTTAERTFKHQTLEEEESGRTSQQRHYQQETEKYSKTAQTSENDVEKKARRQVVLRRYDGRRYTAEELNQAVKNAYTAVDKAYRDLRQWRSSSMQRHNGYLPAHESYHRSTSSRRDREFGGEFGNRYIDNRGGLAHARYGSLSDSLRRGELKYVPNGDFRENYSKNGKMHKSFSTRDVYHDGAREGSWHRGSASGYAPLVEFPPTLPRSARGDPPTLPPHRGFSESHYRPLTKSRSYADWDEGRGPFGSSVKRYEDDMTRLENEFRDSLLMRLPNGNMNEKDHRHEQIPGGHESYSRETKANAGRRLNRDGVPTDFKEASQEYSFKREVQH